MNYTRVEWSTRGGSGIQVHWQLQDCHPAPSVGSLSIIFLTQCVPPSAAMYREWYLADYTNRYRCPSKLSIILNYCPFALISSLENTLSSIILYSYLLHFSCPYSLSIVQGFSFSLLFVCDHLIHRSCQYSPVTHSVLSPLTLIFVCGACLSQTPGLSTSPILSLTSSNASMHDHWIISKSFRNARVYTDI